MSSENRASEAEGEETLPAGRASSSSLGVDLPGCVKEVSPISNTVELSPAGELSENSSAETSGWIHATLLGESSCVGSVSSLGKDPGENDNDSLHSLTDLWAKHNESGHDNELCAASIIYTKEQECLKI